mgnify:CR=1 FL=1
MMNYEIFKEVVKEKFLDHMPDDFANHTVVVHPVNKVNETLDGLSLQSPNGESRQVFPTIYINHMYEEYQKNNDLQSTLDMAAFDMAGAFRAGEQLQTDFNFEDAKDKVVMALVNTEQNREMLKNMPHREFQDLSVIYRYVVSMEPQGIATIPIKNEVAEMMGMEEEQLFHAAAENTKRLLPPQVRSMNDVIMDMFVRDGMPKEMVEVFMEEMPQERLMYVIGNQQGINGAVSMMYEDTLHRLAEELETDLYILPSSVHEVIAVSTDMGDPNELAQMVSEINMDQVALCDRLSNQVYHYDKDLRKLSLATNTPNKRLDGIVAEPNLIYETKQSR